MPLPGRPSRRKRVRRGAVIAVLTASSPTPAAPPQRCWRRPTRAGRPPQSTAGEQPRFFIKVGAGSLADALTRFTTQTGIRVVKGSVDLTGLQSPGVTGTR